MHLHSSICLSNRQISSLGCSVNASIFVRGSSQHGIDTKSGVDPVVAEWWPPRGRCRYVFLDLHHTPGRAERREISDTIHTHHGDHRDLYGQPRRNRGTFLSRVSRFCGPYCTSSHFAWKPRSGMWHSIHQYIYETVWAQERLVPVSARGFRSHRLASKQQAPTGETHEGSHCPHNSHSYNIKGGIRGVELIAWGVLLVLLL